MIGVGLKIFKAETTKPKNVLLPNWRKNVAFLIYFTEKMDNLLI